ncbi:MAG: cytidyltransferase-related domain protein [Oscillibacter sp.]|jgi:nicotinic acid mononucleotide adenylyltransferase|nr:cytidyltransferase-related domain protein [Oscillibacter sp.]
MEEQTARKVARALTDAFAEKSFLRKLGMNQSDAKRFLALVDWESALRPLLPLRERLTCGEVLALCRPMLDAAAPEPAEGWTALAYHVAVTLLYPAADHAHTSAQWDGAMLYLRVLQILLDEERRELPFDPQYDFAFCSEEELRGSLVEDEYRQFLVRFREEHIYELLRLGREVTPFHTLEHIAGVHHVAMTVARAFAKGGGLVDLALMSGAAAGHDLGKFGCRKGERVPYLHYYYTDQWFFQRGLPAIGHIAANHSVWDLEIENLSSESLILVYADFRVKQSKDKSGNEIARIYSLNEAFDVILSKLDNVDAAKERRYRFVYAKLHDFEEYLLAFGVDVTLAGNETAPLPRKDAALLTPDEVVVELRRTAVDHNIRLMHRLGHDQLFANVLENARSEKDWGRIRAYVSVFEEYFTYLTPVQKEQTLDFLYDLLVYPDGDLRRQSAALIGRILAAFRTGYKKELPEGAPADPEDDRPFTLWAEMSERLIQPDRRMTPKQTSMVRYTAKLVVDSLLENCSDADLPRFSEELLRRYRYPAQVDGGTAFALLDAVVNLPAGRCTLETSATLIEFSVWWLHHGELPHKAAVLRLFQHLLSVPPYDAALRARMVGEIRDMDCEGSAPLLFLQARLGRILGFDVTAQEQILADGAIVSNVFLDNLKTATHWVLKAMGVEYLADQVEQGNSQNLLHIATHFSNLIKVSENVIVRRLSGAALLKLAPILTADRRNEIAVELSKSLETGQSEISKYIPEYLGQFSLWLTPRELDEVVEQMGTLLSSANANVVAAALSTVGAILESYAAYGPRFAESSQKLEARRRRLIGLLLKGLASYREPVRQESLRILGEALFASDILSYQDKESLFTLTAKKVLCLIREQDERELTFFYTAAALSHIYRYIVRHKIESGPFHFTIPEKVAFFPGTFDPFSLSHKGIAQSIRDLGFEVYLAIDEFSWSKKAQPSLVRRQLVSMSVADEFDVYLFPHDLPVNLANPGDLQALRRVFSGRELYLAVGSDVVAGASSYRAAPIEGCVQEMNHIVFHRSSDAFGHEIDADLSAITGKVLQLQLPAELEDISSTRIRENIDLGRDISNLIDPAVQDYIYRNSLYLREPQYKQLLRVGYLDFSLAFQPDDTLLSALSDTLFQGRSPQFAPQDALLVLRDLSGSGRILGVLSYRTVNSAGLYGALGDAKRADYIREHTAGRICFITGIHTSRLSGGNYDVAQLLLTEALFGALGDECSYAVAQLQRAGGEKLMALLQRNGFLPVPTVGDTQLALTDMRSPVALIQNISTTLKEPFASDWDVLSAVRQAHEKMQTAITELYPGTLVLSVNAELIYHRLVRKITAVNGVPEEPTHPRVLGEKMCVPFGKILRGNVIPNTVTKTIHTDKVFAPDLRSFTIDAFPGYAPLTSQIRTVKSFRRPVILVDDLLHSGNRVQALDPLFREMGVPIDRVMVGLMSGKGRDLMESHGRTADCVYFIPNLRAWFVESTMYPFIGGDTAGGAKPSVPGLTPAINLILPYAYPRFYRECGRDAVFRFSRVCLENSRDILRTLELVYRAKYARNLTLSRLSEAVILPLSPDKGAALHYDPNLPASACLTSDLEILMRMRDLA